MLEERLRKEIDQARDHNGIIFYSWQQLGHKTDANVAL